MEATYEITNTGAHMTSVIACAIDFESAIFTAEDIARQGTDTYVWHTGYSRRRDLRMIAIVRCVNAGINVPAVMFVGG